ncbi:hypothetical protein H6F74_12980 [Trichocoleus sp. FACHB-90]|uniref:hypothetical protein n=1 Tax=Cyanophyceae TaxID=3028117 RepID=UPI0016857AD9|nr:hypothetical protein [Trichocoleus sp. FACHB-90]MBD1927151.1 hypothetical protein [Trichocoleus sp. FACHB-90]
MAFTFQLGWLILLRKLFMTLSLALFLEGDRPFSSCAIASGCHFSPEGDRILVRICNY